MGRVVVSEFVSLDGVMEDPGGSEGFEHGGWTRPYWDDVIERVKSEELFAADALLLGRVTYQGFAAAWPAMADTGPFGERMNNLPKWVASTTLTQMEWNARRIEGPVEDVVGRLRRETGETLLVYGSATLVQTLLQHELVDELRLLVYPLTLGSGKRLFTDTGKPTQSLALVEATPSSSGVVFLHYRRAAG